MNISEMQIHDLLDLLQKTIKEVDRTGHVWADAKATYEDLEDKRKSVLANVMGSQEGGQGLKEQKALASETYLNHLGGLKESRRLYLHSQVDYDLSKLKCDAIRSILSARKEEVKNFKG